MAGERFRGWRGDQQFQITFLPPLIVLVSHWDALCIRRLPALTEC